MTSAQATPRSLVATEADRGQRVDRFLAERLPALSRARLQGLIEAGSVFISGQPAGKATRLRGYETVTVLLPDAAPSEPQPEALPLERVFQDDDVLVLNKPAGMVVHPGAGHAGGTLVNALLHHVAGLRGVGDAERPGLVHRLDRDTSGLLVVALNAAALATLQRAFKAHAVEKTYLALVFGQPADAGTFRTPYRRHPTRRLRFTGKAGGDKEAVTHWVVRRRFARGALVEVRLETGRTHQIRVHFSEAGHPLFSDALYGTRASRRPELIERQALHAWRLAFAHPRTGERLTFTAPPPADFAQAEARLAAE